MPRLGHVQQALGTQGGDRSAVDAILAAPQLAAVAALRTGRLLDVPEPRHAVLVTAVAAARAVPILIREPVTE